MLITTNNLNFTGKKNKQCSKDISTKTKLKEPKVREARQLRYFIDDLQLIPEYQRSYYSEQMTLAKFKPNKLKTFVPKILKIV
jgi:hypothetical protein